MTEPTPRTISTSAGDVGVEILGKGHPVVLLPGGAESNASTGKAPTAELAKRFMVFTVELFNAGREADVTVSGLATALTEIFDQLELASARVFGHHAGALVALEAAATYPDRIERLVLSGTPLWTTDERRDLLAALPAKAPGESLDGYLSRLTSTAATSRQTEDTADLARATVEYDARSRLAKITCPCLVLNSLSDPFGRWLYELADLIPGADLAMVADGDLFGQLDGETLATVLNDFFS